MVPYFGKLSYTISDILHHSPEIVHPFFDQRPAIKLQDRRIGFLVITSDKGLAGAYNHNVLKLAEQQLQQTTNSTLFVVGQMGRTHFASKEIEINQSFEHTAQNPTISHAREMTEPLLGQFLAKELDEIWVIYTNMVTPLHLEPTLLKLLPLDRDIFPWQPRHTEEFNRTVNYHPSVSSVLDHLVPDYFTGMLFGTMVESFCSEQSARMTAMDSSTKNAKEMLRRLTLTYNRARQSAITQEITEVVGGTRGQEEY